ncbi:GCN5 family N-acetyltransferase [Amylibacter marinus]|uniref:GCN5 family N-acetyltransferase n=1 Tax=Amylibacter marinus TaxID=1475483 RepID=A0ABQ5VUB7_9RHOB|nr:GNAT family N-acetyltransferase [Amylibacter marinus]GLQ34818.1 GCN5 family N-acetyltransferase [Amylibacter marinus]
MTLVIRAVDAGMAPDWRRLWRHYLEFYNTEKPPEIYDAAWARIIAPDSGMHSALAFHDDQAVGLVNYLYHDTFWSVEPRIYLNDLFVDPNVRGTGAGRALIEYVEAECRKEGAECLYWLTAEDNMTARRLYDKVSRLTPFIKYEIR